MTLFTKSDDGTYITYTGITGTSSEGTSYVVKKDDPTINVHVIKPVSSSPETWQQLVADLDVYI